MRGREVFYPMGWDDNGLPTERRVQNYFGVRCDPSLPYDPSFQPPDKPGKQPISVSRPNFVDLCTKLTIEDEKAFEALWRYLGLSVDWDMGINLRPAAYPPELADRAGSIESELGRQVDPGAVLAQVLTALNLVLDELWTAGAPPVVARWLALSPSVYDTPIAWDGGEGVTAGLAEDGALLARSADGLHRIIAGEVRWK